jgi:hypothetical protein
MQGFAQKRLHRSASGFSSHGIYAYVGPHPIGGLFKEDHHVFE